MDTRISPSTGRMRAFRLNEVPIDVRLRAADRLIPQEDSLGKRIELGTVARMPSSRVYFVSEEAWEKVMRPRRSPKRSARATAKAVTQ